ncbi:MAG: hypothetical protein ACI9MR_004912 [Myxococcota bacterium]|jgi:hypothetical protein
MPKVHKSSMSHANVEAVQDNVQLRSKKTNTDPKKQSGYAEQAAALEPKGSGKITDIDFEIKHVHLYGKSSYAEIEFKFWRGRESVTETHKIKFVRPKGGDDWDTAEAITEATVAAPQLEAKNISMKAALDYDALYKPSLMALRDKDISPKSPW